VSRGFAEVDVQVNANYSFTLITAHLKSKRAVAQADEAELRLEEAKVLREKIDDRLAADQPGRPGAHTNGIWAWLWKARLVQEQKKSRPQQADARTGIGSWRAAL
jgi:hypothetical protein